MLSVLGPAWQTPACAKRFHPTGSTPYALIGPAYTGCGGFTAPAINADFEQQVVERINAVRAEHALPPLKRASELDAAARYHATDMGQDDYVDHDSYDRVGSALLWACAWNDRIQSYYGHALWLGENIAAGPTSPQDVLEVWLNSPPHRALILSADGWELGVGYYEGSGRYHRYWVQDVGRRAGVYPLVINREAATTESRDVSLYIYGDWEEMRLRNDNGPWTGWQPFQARMHWTLNEMAGERVVWAELRSGSRSVTAYDSIYLLSATPTLTPSPTATATNTPMPARICLPMIIK